MGSAIARLREQGGMSRPELATAANVSAEYIRLLETGRIKQPSLLYLSRVAAVFGLAAHDLMVVDVSSAAALPYMGPTTQERVAIRIAALVPPDKLPALETLVRVWAGLDDAHQYILTDVGRLFAKAEGRAPLVLPRVAEEREDYGEKEM